MKAYGEVETSALVGGEWSASRPGSFASGGIATGTQWVAGWVGPGVALEGVEKRKIFSLPEMELEPFCPEPLAIPTELSGLLLKKGKAVPVTGREGP
jgi:hypothetical protein